MSSPNNPNINYNAILVEKHYIPVDIYTRMYGVQPAQNNLYSQLYTNASGYITQQPSTITHNTHERTQQPNMNSHAPSRYNDLLSFFNMQARNTGPANTEPLQSRLITRTYETAADMDQSFVNLLMTAFYTPQSTTVNTTRLTPEQIDAQSRIITYSANVDLDSATCSICAQEWQHGEEVRKLTRCRHYFHKSCVDTWLRDHNTCPLCRTNIVQTPATNRVGGINDVD